MAIKRPDIYEHNNVNYAIADSDFVRGGFRTAVADLTALYALSPKADQLKEFATIVYVTDENKYYILQDIVNVANVNGWEEFQTGGGAGTITGATNGLSTGTTQTIILGGDLTQNTTINGLGAHDLSIANIGGFNVSTSGGTAEIIVEPNGITLAYSGQSVSFDNNKGLTYDNDYSLNFVDRSLVDKGYVDTVALGLQIHAAVNVATTGDTNLSSPPSSIDGVTLSDGNRILIKNQISGATNGIYIWHSSGMTRAADYNFLPSGEISNGDLIPVLSGNTYANTLWVLATQNPIVSGDTLTFTPFSTPGNYSGGIGINVIGTVISLNGSALAGDHINWNNNKFNVVPSGITSGYTTLTHFNSYTGTTETRLDGIESDLIYVSGVTNSKLDIDIFTGYTANTDSRLDDIESNIIYISGVTNTKLDIDAFTGYTATTNQAITNIENDISYISGITSGLTTSKLDVSIFDAYTGTTELILSVALTGATNGLTKIGRSVVLGGDLSGGTTINLCDNTLKLQSDTANAYGLADFSLNSVYANSKFGLCSRDGSGAQWGLSGNSTSISTYHCINSSNGSGIVINNTGLTLTNKCSSALKSVSLGCNGLIYADCYHSSYINRTLVDKEYVDKELCGTSNVVNVCIIGVEYYTQRYDDLIGVSGLSTNQIYLYPTPVLGQRVSVVDICGNALADPITINGYGKNINDGACSTINTDYGSVTFVYNGIFWSAIAFVN